MKPEYVVCVPVSLSGYEPPFEVHEGCCDGCHNDIWLPVNLCDMPMIGTWEAEFFCVSCFAKKMIQGEIEEDSITHFMGMENWPDNEPRFFQISQQQLDQEMAWAEENLPVICRTALALFPRHEDLLHHMIWRAVLLLVWHILQSRWNGGLSSERIFDRWSDTDSNRILEFLMWQPKPIEEQSEPAKSKSM